MSTEGDLRSPGEGPVRVSARGEVREIRLSRPAVHNALDEAVIAALTRAFLDVAAPGETAPPRAVLLAADGRSFCSGADVQYMRRVAAYSVQENLADGRRLAALFRAVRGCPIPVVARVQGTALGGGCGLLAACDLVIAVETARFGFPEVRLGIIPATISPFVVERIGATRARALFSTGEIVGAVEARRAGLVDRVVSPEKLDAEIDQVLAAVLAAGPGASRAAKRLADQVAASLGGHGADAEPGAATVAAAAGATTGAATAPRVPRAPQGDLPSSLDPALGEETARLIAELRALPEAREGLLAYLEKRPPSWHRPWPPLAEPGAPAAGEPGGGAAAQPGADARDHPPASGN